MTTETLDIVVTAINPYGATHAVVCSVSSPSAPGVFTVWEYVLAEGDDIANLYEVLEVNASLAGVALRDEIRARGLSVEDPSAVQALIPTPLPASLHTPLRATPDKAVVLSSEVRRDKAARLSPEEVVLDAFS